MSKYFIGLLDNVNDLLEKNGHQILKESERLKQKEKQLSELPSLNEFLTIMNDISEYMITNPGTLIALPSMEMKDKYKEIMNAAFQYFDEDEFAMSLVDGHNLELNWDHWDTLVENALEVRPTFINIRFKQADFEPYFNEAMKAWSFGLYTAALIMTHSILEESLRFALYFKFGTELTDLYEIKGYEFRPSKSWRMYELTATAVDRKIIDKKQGDFIEEISIARNKTIHQLKHMDADRDKVLEYIQFSVSLVEELFG